MNICDLLELETLRRARVVAGSCGLDREVRWVHVVDVPNPLPWVKPRQLVLTTGYAWPHDAASLRCLVQSLAGEGVSAVGMAVPQFFESVPPAVREAAEGLCLPVLEIPWEIPFAQISEEALRRILAEQYEVMRQSEDVHRKLTRAAIELRSLQELADTLGSLIGRAVTVEDTSGNVLAYYAVEAMQDDVRKQTLERLSSPAELTKLLDELGYTRPARSHGHPFRVPAMPDVGLKERVLCPIWLSGEHVGWVWIIEGDKPLSELDLRAAEHAAVVAASHIANQRQLATLEARLGHAFLDSLLEGAFDGSPQVLERARLMGFDPTGCYRTCLLALATSAPLTAAEFEVRERLAQRVSAVLTDLGIKPLVSLHLNRVAFLVPDGRSVERVWELLANEPEALALAAGRAHCGPEGVRRSYLEATSLSPHVGRKGLHLYETFLVDRVLSGDVEARAALQEELFGALRQVKGGSVVIDTLAELARNDFHQGDTARRLGIHVNTLRYRLQRAEELGGVELSSRKTRFKLQLASHLLELEHKE